MEYKFTLPSPEKLNIKLYSPDGEYILDINTTIELYDIRCQIKEECHIDGFYIILDNGKKVIFDKYGRMERSGKNEESMRKFENYLDILLG